MYYVKNNVAIPRTYMSRERAESCLLMEMLMTVGTSFQPITK